VPKRILKEGTRVVGSGCFFSSPKGDGERIFRTAGDWKNLVGVLDLLFGMLRDGVFPAGCEKQPCGFCDYKTVCGR